MSVLCPKCQTSYTWIETDPHSGGTPMLRCRCGLCIYGMGAVERIVQDQQEEAERHRKRDLEKALVIEEERIANQCAWATCGNERRPTSKYCSRDCSNKNARARHQKRRRVA